MRAYTNNKRQKGEAPAAGVTVCLRCEKHF